MEAQRTKLEVTATRASETPEPAVGGGSPQKPLSASHNPEVGVASKASTSGIATAETAVPSGTHRNMAPEGEVNTEVTKNTEQVNNPPTRRVIDIGALFEDELLGKIRGYINSMCAFAQANRNVHRELKETLANSSILMAQYVKVVNHGRAKEVAAKATCGSATNQQKATSEVAAIATEEEGSVLAEIRAISSKLNEHGELIAALAAGRPGVSNASTWTEVVRRKPPAKKDRMEQKDDGTVDEGRTQPKKKDIAKASRKKPPAIKVRVNDGSYSEALKKLKLNEQVKAFSDDIVGLTKTTDGDLLVKLNPRTESLQLVETIGTAMGNRSVVKELVHYQRVVVQDLDEQAEPEEIKDAIFRQIGVEIEKVKVRSGTCPEDKNGLSCHSQRE